MFLKEVRDKPVILKQTINYASGIYIQFLRFLKTQIFYFQLI